MIKLNLQFFGGRGATGNSLGNGKEKKINEKWATDLVSERENPHLKKAVDEVLNVARDMENEYGYQAYQYRVADIGGSSAMAYYRPEENTVTFNVRYSDANAMNGIYDEQTRKGFHPSRGKKTGMEAVASHEIGHALTEQAFSKIGMTATPMTDKVNAVAGKIVKDVTKSHNIGAMEMAKQISGYATESNAECIAEAFSDVYCNGKKANKYSKIIVAELKKYL